MFENFFKKITFADVVKELYDIVREYDMIETENKDKDSGSCSHAYTLNPGQTYWFINIFTKKSEIGEVPFKIAYIEEGSWQIPKDQLEFVAPGDKIHMMSSDNLLSTMPLRKWNSMKDHLRALLLRARKEYTSITKCVKTTNIIAEAARG